MICPCKTCNERTIECHSKCQGYKDWKKWYDEVKAEKRKQDGNYRKSGERWIYTVDGHWRKL